MGALCVSLCGIVLCRLYTGTWVTLGYIGLGTLLCDKVPYTFCAMQPGVWQPHTTEHAFCLLIGVLETYSPKGYPPPLW